MGTAFAADAAAAAAAAAAVDDDAVSDDVAVGGFDDFRFVFTASGYAFCFACAAVAVDAVFGLAFACFL
jgi:hypothetical protein